MSRNRYRGRHPLGATVLERIGPEHPLTEADLPQHHRVLSPPVPKPAKDVLALLLATAGLAVAARNDARIEMLPGEPITILITTGGRTRSLAPRARSATGWRTCCGRRTGSRTSCSPMTSSMPGGRNPMRVDRRAFHAALKELGRIARPQRVLPILSNVLLHATQGCLKLTATDLAQTLKVELPAEGELHAILPAKLLADLVKPAGKEQQGTVTLEPVAGRPAVKIDEAGSLEGIDPQTFPAGPADLDWSLLGIWPAEALGQALSFVLPAASRDTTRPTLCTVCLNEGHAITTDGHRLHLASIPVSLEKPILLPVSSAATLARLLRGKEQVVVAQAKGRVRFRVGSWELETKLTEAVFPPWKHVVPSHDARDIILSTEVARLSSALIQLGRVSENLTTRVNGALTLGAFEPGPPEAKLELVVQTLTNSHSGDDLVTGFNSRYLTEALAGAGEKIEMRFTTPLAPLRLDLDGGRVAVIMPVRV
jgi:DNA polymerase-3 subunit beta